MQAEVDEDELRGGGPPTLLHGPLARSVWARDPAMRLYYYPADDALVVEIVDAPMAAAVEGSHLRVEFDGDGADAWPTTLCLTGVHQLPDSEAAGRARWILGDYVWSRLPEVVREGELDLRLPLDVARDRREVWRGLVGVLRPRWRCFDTGPRRAIGIELFGTKLRGALVDRAGRIRADGVRALRGTTPAAVVAEIADLVSELAGPDPAAASAPVGVQFGGPVTEEGIVEFFDKLDGEPWRNADVRSLLERATGRRVTVVNDAEALAELESATGAAEFSRVGVVIVGQGIGARLIEKGRPTSYPMEIGVLVPNPWTAEATHRHPGSIEATASVPAIVEAARSADPAVRTMSDVAAVAAAGTLASDKVCELVEEAGRRLAHGLGSVQAILNPRVWVVYGPPELMDESRRAARAYFAGLRRVNEHLGFDGLWDPVIEPKAMFGSEGARAAASAALAAIERSGLSADSVSPPGGQHQVR